MTLMSLFLADSPSRRERREGINAGNKIGEDLCELSAFARD